MVKLQGLVRKSNCAAMISSQPVLQAPEEPGRQKIYVALATPGIAMMKF